MRARWQRWWQARPPPSDTHTLTQRNVYILPRKRALVDGQEIGEEVQFVQVVLEILEVISEVLGAVLEVLERGPL